jgi:hypothetical protein
MNTCSCLIWNLNTAIVVSKNGYEYEENMAMEVFLGLCF